jgi:antirestriction protein ArdC
LKPPAVENIVSRKPYRGINTLVLGSTDCESPFLGSFKEALDLGGDVRWGEKSTPIIYCKIVERDEAGNLIVREDAGPTRIPFVRWANVFNLDQTEGMPAPALKENQSTSYPLEKAASIIENTRLCPIHHAGFAACYAPKDDIIRIRYPPHSTARRTIITPLPRDDSCVRSRPTSKSGGSHGAEQGSDPACIPKRN